MFELLGAPWKKHWYCFFRGTSSVYHFHSVLCPDTRVFILVCRYLPKVPGKNRCCTKETSMLLLSWCTLCIAFWKYKVPWFLIAYFNLLLATHIPDENLFFLSGNFWCSTKKALILLLSWSTLYISFSI